MKDNQPSDHNGFQLFKKMPDGTIGKWLGDLINGLATLIICGRKGDL